MCCDPQVGQFLAAAMSGDLKAPERTEDYQRFREHFKTCKKCRSEMAEHITETLTIPALREFAQERGLPFIEVLDAFTGGSPN
jgi:hypothetical protein